MQELGWSTCDGSKGAGCRLVPEHVETRSYRGSQEKRTRSNILKPVGPAKIGELSRVYIQEQLREWMSGLEAAVQARWRESGPGSHAQLLRGRPHTHTHIHTRTHTHTHRESDRGREIGNREHRGNQATDSIVVKYLYNS